MGFAGTGTGAGAARAALWFGSAALWFSLAGFQVLVHQPLLPYFLARLGFVSFLATPIFNLSGIYPLESACTSSSVQLGPLSHFKK